jgi:PAS domain S-box-containing protein
MFGRIQIKIMILIGLITASSVGALVFYRHAQFDQMDTLIQQRQREKTTLLNLTMDVLGKSHANIVYDYTVWDDMVEFVNNPDESWATENIREGLKTYGVHAAWVFDLDLNLVYSTCILQSETALPFPLSKPELSSLLDNSKFPHFSAVTSAGVTEFRLAPIQASADVERTSPPHGYCAVGRVWNDNYIREIASLTTCKISIAADSSALRAAHRDVDDPSQIVSSATLYAWDGKPLAQVTAISSYPAVKSFLAFMREVELASILFSVLLLSVVSLFLFRFVGTPLALISTALRKNSPELITVLRDDRTEFGTISRLIQDFFAQRNALAQEVTQREQAEVNVRRSLSLLQATLDSTTDGILVVGEQGNVVSYNTQFLRMWEIPPALAAENDDHVLLDYVLNQVKDPGEFIKRVADLYAHPDQTSSEVVEFKDGRIFERYSQPQRIDNVTLGRVWSFRDVTERKYSETALRESESKFRSIAEQMNDVIYLGNMEGIVTYVSPAAERVFGLLPEEMIGTRFTDYLLPSDIEKAIAVFKDALEKRSVMVGLGVTMQRKDGTTFEAELDASFMIQNGQLTGTLGVIRDVSERIAAEKALRDSERLLSESQIAAGVGSYEMDLTTGIWNNSIVMDEILGIDASFEKTVPGWISLIHPEWQQHMLSYFQNEIISACGRFDKEYKIIRLCDGQERWVHGLGKLELDASGKPVHMVGTIQDITDRKATEQALAARETEYSNLVENSGEGIAVVDCREVFTFANKVADEIFGVEPGGLKGRSILDFLPESEKAHVLEESAKRAAGDRSAYELNIIRPNGTMRNLLVTASPKFTSNGNYEGSFGIFHDTTELKHAEIEKRKLELQLRQSQKLETIGTLAGGIAHDFNNILTPIIIYTEMASMRLESGHPTREALEHVMRSANRAKDLVKQILTFSRQTEQERFPIELSSIVKEATKLLRASIPSTIDIDVNVRADCGIVLADPSQIHQVLMNLCTNAFHAMRETGGVLTVELAPYNVDAALARAHSKLLPGDYVRLTVSDTGCGMDAAAIQRIFEPFFTTKPVGEGTGLGLSVVHGIVSSHGGDIIVRSEPGQGSTFEVYFPRVRLDQIKPSADVSPIVGGNENILIVDDEAEVAETTRQVLEMFGYSVTVRTSSIEALELFRNDPKRFDLLITDQTMPHMTGEQLAKEIMAIRMDLPIILMTGFSSEIDDRRCKQLGIDRFLLKPLLPTEITRSVRSVLDGIEAG